MPGLQIVREGQEPPRAWGRSLYLAGPGDAGWREAALELLKQRGYDGVVFVPDDRDEAKASQHTGSWRGLWLRRSDVVLVWLPTAGPQATVVLARVGEWADSGRLAVGVADGFPGASELRRWAGSRRVQVASTLAATVDHALDIMPPGQLREGPEREIPLIVWRDPACRAWLDSQRGGGNELVEVVRVWPFRRGRGLRELVFSALLPRMRVTAEGREEFGEAVLIRPDQAAVLLYWPAPDPADTKIALVRDYRVAARTRDGYVWELPSGSRGADALELVAAWECEEEIGIAFPPDRLRGHGARQVFASMSGHVCRLFSVEGTAEELDYLLSQEGVAHGVHSDDEFTFPVVVTRAQLPDLPIDWSMLGMITSALDEVQRDPGHNPV